MSEDKKQSGTGLPRKTAVALATLLGPTIIAPFVILILEKDFHVRFHALQSIVVFVALMVLSLVFGIVLTVLAPVVWIAMFSAWLALVYKASQGEAWDMPFVGKLVRDLLKKD